MKKSKEILENAISEIKETLECEKDTFECGGKEDKNVQGWIEGLEYVLNLLEPEEAPEPELPEGLQKYIDGVGLNILYRNYHKSTNGIWSRAEIDEHLDDGHGEYYVVNVDFGCQDDTRNEKYRDTIYVYHNGKEWYCNRTIPAQTDKEKK